MMLRCNGKPEKKRNERAGQEAMFQEVKKPAQQWEKEKLQKNRVTGALNTNSLIDKVEIKSYDIQHLDK